MALLKTIYASLLGWLDSVARAGIAAVDRMVAPRSAHLVENANGEFSLRLSGANAEHLKVANGRIDAALRPETAGALRGTRADIVLRPDRFVFKPLELPVRASEFLDGVVRAQIDRLTPWNAADAAFGWSKPTDTKTGRIVVTIAATAKSAIEPFVRSLASLGVKSVAVFTEGSDGQIKVMEDRAGGSLDAGRIRPALLAILVAAALAAVIAGGASIVLGDRLETQQDALARRIAQIRSAAMNARTSAANVAPTGQRALEIRKQETPSGVIVLDILSQLLPDHTYVTELRIEGDRLRISGMTQDAPGLIRVIEQSSHFTRAIFFAPTTRGPSETADRFHIEAKIEPNFSPRP